MSTLSVTTHWVPGGCETGAGWTWHSIMVGILRDAKERVRL